ncbi:histidine phosphatase family protein [Sabulilitoribacter multivorans]|uniref:Histidine phosphatase family protein n=1 Tax=Flaviramulus multivorans TaxID=1304750 RepID=A0ABS9IIQ7_9FLAO|nr:histidine phosphatase family protein [Flaviramulus multivorans]MCF7560637.1 histidine phosphatase family protein [Flaviramulus multivorans]
MKNIIIVRHAKSSWEFNVSDHERPLKSRGVNDANLVSKAFKESNTAIDLVISSDAVRARTTADIFVNTLKISDYMVSLNHDLYDFSGNDLINVIKSVRNSVNNLMLFGHNHAITYFVNSFGDLYIDNVPTCGLVALQFDIENWSDLRKGKTIKTIFPRDLK